MQFHAIFAAKCRENCGTSLNWLLYIRETVHLHPVYSHSVWKAKKTDPEPCEWTTALLPQLLQNLYNHWIKLFGLDAKHSLLPLSSKGEFQKPLRQRTTWQSVLITLILTNTSQKEFLLWSEETGIPKIDLHRNVFLSWTFGLLNLHELLHFNQDPRKSPNEEMF